MDAVHWIAPQSGYWIELNSEWGQISFLRLAGFEITDEGSEAEDRYSFGLHLGRWYEGFTVGDQTRTLRFNTFVAHEIEQTDFKLFNWSRGKFGDVALASRYSAFDSMVKRPTFELVTIPHRYAALVFALLPGLALIRSFFIARRKRRSRGLCAGCGYDLRVTPERCPECGRAI